MPLKEQTEKLPTIQRPVGNNEYRMNNLAQKFNNLKPSDPGRKKILDKYRELEIRESFD